MKIAFCITSLGDTGGAQVHVRDLALALMDQGHRVDILGGQPGAFAQSLREVGVRVHVLAHLGRALHPVRDFLAYREIRRKLSEISPELVSIHSSKAGVVGRLAAFKAGIPCLFTVHGWAFAAGVPATRKLIAIVAEKAAARWVERIIAVSRQDKELALRHKVAPERKLVVVHNGMPDAPCRSEPGGEGPLRLVMVGRFQQPKDHELLLQALGGCGFDWKLDLVGEGPEKAKAQQLVTKLGMDGSVRFLGERMDVAELLCASQAFVLASKWEGFPRSILEAMRAGLPVVTSDVGGVREAVTDGLTGYVVPRGNKGLLIERLTRLAVDPELRSRMGLAGRAAFEEHFTFERMFSKTVSVYEELLGMPVKIRSAHQPLS